MKSSQEWQVGAVSLPPLQRGTTWCPRVGTVRLQNAQISFKRSIRKQGIQTRLQAKTRLGKEISNTTHPTSVLNGP